MEMPNIYKRHVFIFLQVLSRAFTSRGKPSRLISYILFKTVRYMSENVLHLYLEILFDIPCNYIFEFLDSFTISFASIFVLIFINSVIFAKIFAEN